MSFPPCYSQSLLKTILFTPPPPHPFEQKWFETGCGKVNILYGNLTSENSQDYAQKPQLNCVFMKSASGHVILAVLVINFEPVSKKTKSTRICKVFLFGYAPFKTNQERKRMLSLNFIYKNNNVISCKCIQGIKKHTVDKTINRLLRTATIIVLYM